MGHKIWPGVSCGWRRHVQPYISTVACINGSFLYTANAHLSHLNKRWILNASIAACISRDCACALQLQRSTFPLLNSTQRATTDAGDKHTQCPHLSSRYCIKRTTGLVKKMGHCRPLAPCCLRLPVTLKQQERTDSYIQWQSREHHVYTWYLGLYGDAKCRRIIYAWTFKQADRQEFATRRLDETTTQLTYTTTQKKLPQLVKRCHILFHCTVQCSDKATEWRDLCC